MKKGVIIIFLLTCFLITPSVIMFQSSSPTTHGEIKDLSISSKIVYTYNNLSSANPIQIPISPGWDITSINMTFPNIRAPNSTISLEEETTYAIYVEFFPPAMSFQLPENQTSYLHSISLYLMHYPIELPPSGINLNLSIYNATSTNEYGPTMPKPHKLLANISLPFDLYTGSIGWKDFYLPNSYRLDPEINTFNNTFFISVTNSTPLPWYEEWGMYYSVYWFWAYDDGINEDKGYAYWYNGTHWNLEDWGYTIDYCMRVHLSVSDIAGYYEKPLPTDVNMKVNGTAVEDVSRGAGWCNLLEKLNVSSGIASLIVDTSWIGPIEFSLTIEVYGVDVLGIMYTRSLTTFFTYSFMKENQDKFFLLLGLIALGAVIAGGYGGRTVYKRRRIPLNALRSMENILVDHNPTGTMIWSFDFISMQQDIALISGFMSAIKLFLEEMKVGGLKRLSTEFGTFIREESQLLTATCISSDIGLDEELWIRGKLHEFLIQIEQKHYKQLETFKGDVGQFKESFPAILASLIDLNKVQTLQRQKIEKLAKKKDKLQKKVNKYGAKLENLKDKYDSGEIDFKKYIVERYKTEAKYDKVQKDYLYTSLFLSRAPYLIEAKPLTPKAMEKMEKIQKRFLEIRGEIDKLRIKEWEGTITSNDIERKEKLQGELMTLMEKLDKLTKT
ncbi:MAG: hypothetical protein ACETWM_08870 [Candidatus Lokiarchaeia archaeon]